MKTRFHSEDIIGTIHALLHADDTIMISTKKEIFIQKCNTMLEYFKENKLRLNLKKSGYLVIGERQKYVE